jgi:hypothetical protein
MPIHLECHGESSVAKPCAPARRDRQEVDAYDAIFRVLRDPVAPAFDRCSYMRLHWS